jgi:hypothetical protein
MIQYNQPIEVTVDQYELIRTRLAGGVATRKEGGKYFVKLWIIRYLPLLKEMIK